MELSPLYLQRLENATQEGIQQGLQQGIEQGIQQGMQQGMQQGIKQGLQQGFRQNQRLMVESMLQVKFGAIDEELAQIIEPLLELSPSEVTQLILERSREELLTRFQT